jgi:hypothetical protein
MGKALSTQKNGKPGVNDHNGVSKNGSAAGVSSASTPTTTKSVEGENFVPGNRILTRLDSPFSGQFYSNSVRFIYFIR